MWTIRDNPGRFYALFLKIIEMFSVRTQFTLLTSVATESIFQFFLTTQDYSESRVGENWIFSLLARKFSLSTMEISVDGSFNTTRHWEDRSNNEQPIE